MHIRRAVCSDTKSAYNATVEISLHQYTGARVTSARLLFVRSPVPAVADAFRSYRILVVTFTAHIFLDGSWRKPLCTAAQIVRDESHA